MAFTLNKRQIILAGAIAGALTAIGGALAAFTPVVKNVVESGPLPVPSRVELAQLAKQLQELQTTTTLMQQHQTVQDKVLDLDQMSRLQFELLNTEKDAGPHPSLSMQHYIQSLKDQINTIRTRLKLTPVQ